MSKVSMHPRELDRARLSTPMIDKCAIVAISACAYSVIVFPVIYILSAPANTLEGIMATRQENRIFWPAVAAIAIVLAVRHRSRLFNLSLPPHFICLLAYLAFAGASVAWAFRPELSFIRYVQQLMVLISIVLPAMLALRTTDMMRGLFLCFALAAILNVFFVFDNSEAVVATLKGYPGYFTGKNLLGEFAGIALMLAIHEILYPGRRRVSGVIVAVIATSLLFWSNSKTALGLTLVAPFLAGLTLAIGKAMRISPAIVLLSIPLCYVVLSIVSNFDMYRVSYLLYGDSTFTGRKLIWDFAFLEIERRPLLGWGYQSFWLVGADAPSILDAPRWIKTMPNAHNGYVDTMLEMGYVGLALLLAFIFTTLHALGRVAGRAPARAWLLLSLALFVIFYNFLESTWMRAFDLMWVVFVMVAAEVGRYWQPNPSIRAAYRSKAPVQC